MAEDNSHAGQGAVLLDIGADIGALVVLMPDGLVGTEIEVRPLAAHTHDEDPHQHHHPHAAVTNRPRDGHGGPPVASLVFAELGAGDYELCRLPHGPRELTVTVTGGEVTHASWPR